MIDLKNIYFEFLELFFEIQSLFDAIVISISVAIT